MFDTLGEVDVSNTGMDYNLQKHWLKPAATANHGTQNENDRKNILYPEA